jgi:hypothetical protein
MALTTDRFEDYASDSQEPGEEQDERAVQHRRKALAALDDGQHQPVEALVHALLALEARVEEMSVYVTRLG